MNCRNGAVDCQVSNTNTVVDQTFLGHVKWNMVTADWFIIKSAVKVSAADGCIVNGTE